MTLIFVLVVSVIDNDVDMIKNRPTPLLDEEELNPNGSWLLDELWMEKK